MHHSLPHKMKDGGPNSQKQAQENSIAFLFNEPHAICKREYSSQLYWAAATRLTDFVCHESILNKSSLTSLST